MLMLSFPKAQLRGPREKLVMLRGVPRVCVSVWQGRGGVTPRQPAAQWHGGLSLQFLQILSVYCWFSFAILFLILSVPSFKNSPRVNSSNCFLTERKVHPDECFLCSSIGSSSGSQPSNSLKQKKHGAKSGLFSAGRWMKPAVAICSEMQAQPSKKGQFLSVEMQWFLR